MNNLIDCHTNSWDMDLFMNIMDPKDILYVCALHLCSQDRLDVMGWHFTKSGKYTVISGNYTDQTDVEARLKPNSLFWPGY